MAEKEAIMSRNSDALDRAIDRWTAAGLIDEFTAAKLRADVAREASAGTRTMSQYIVAITAGTVLLIAASVFLDWAWPRLGGGARSFMLAAAGVAVVVFGMTLEDRTGRWRPAAYLLQTSGLGLLLTAFMYSERAWVDSSSGGVVAGILSLVVPIALAPRSLRRNVVMPAVHLAFALAFLAAFLDRAVHLAGDETVWVLDVVLAVATLSLARMLGREGGMERHPWALNAFVMAIVAGFVLVTLTALGPLSLRESAVWPLDVWLLLAVGLAVWGIERGPDTLSREWLGSLLACLLLAWIGLGFFTALEALDGPAELPLLVVGGAGLVAFVYANRAGLRQLMGAAALAFVLPLWYWGVERGGALGAVAALVATAGILFWVSGRIGPRERAG
jgi:predicted membrane channel-forming protein YqfA (hemolysin III family)